MIKASILLVGALIGLSAQAQSAVIVHGVSYHSVGEHNNANYGVGYRTDDGFVLGVYRNSEWSTSVYAGYDWRIRDWFGVTFAAAVGYKETPVMPIVMPYVSIPIAGPVRFNVAVGPTVSDGRVGVLVHSFIGIDLD
jgi:hypothetical protein